MQFILRKTDKHIIKNLIEKESAICFAPAQFLLAALSEIGLIDGYSEEDIFDLYFKAAEQKYKPAWFRISCADLTLTDKLDRTLAWDYYVKSQKSGEVEFCLGGAILFGWDIEAHTDLGEIFLSKSINKGNLNAENDLKNYYHSMQLQ